MNDNLLLLVNGWAGKNSFVDSVGVFFATYLVYVVFLIAALCIAYCTYKREWKQVLYFCIALVVTFITLRLVALLKIDHRPFMDHVLTQLVPHAPGDSFPSDHTTSSAAVALGVIFFTRFKKVGIGLLVAAFTIGFSRIFVGVHYPADIAGGLITALIGVGLIALLKRKIDAKNPHVTNPASQPNK